MTTLHNNYPMGAGDGDISDPRTTDCDHCNHSGLCADCLGSGHYQDNEATCKTCKGSGECRMCGGMGSVPKSD